MPQVTVDDMVRAVREADKPLTASGIAEATGVTQQAISARRDELEADERIEYGQVGNARAYWIADDVGDDGKQPENPPTERRGGDISHDDVVEGFGEERRQDTQSNTAQQEADSPEMANATTVVELLLTKELWWGALVLMLLSVPISLVGPAVPVLAPVLNNLAIAFLTVGIGINMLGVVAWWTLRSESGGHPTPAGDVDEH